MEKERIELCCHTCMDQKGALPTVEELLSFAKNNNMDGIGITDFAGILSLPELCKKKYANTKVILGMEANVLFENNCKHPVTILVKNKVGLRDLIRLVNNGELNKTEKFPVIEKDSLWNPQNREGLLLGASDELAKEVVFGSDYEKKKEIVSRYDFVLIDVNRSVETNLEMVQLAEGANIPAVATSQVCYMDVEDKFSYDVLMYGKYEQSPLEEKRHFMYTEEMLEALSYLGDRTEAVVIDNTHVIAKMCERFMMFPKEPIYPIVKDGDKKLRRICETALKKQYEGKKLEVAKSRLNWELMSIEYTNSHFIFLLLREYMRKLKVKPWERSFRGDSPSSIVAYLCGITDLDPVEHNLNPYFTFGLDGKRTIQFDLNLLKEKYINWSEVFEECSIPIERIFVSDIVTTPEVKCSFYYSRYLTDILKTGKITKDYQAQDYVQSKLEKVFWERSVNKNSFYIIPKEYDYSGQFPISVSKDGETISYFHKIACNKYFYCQYVFETRTLDVLQNMIKTTKSDLSKVSFDDKKVLEVLKPIPDAKIDVNKKVGVFDFAPYELDVKRALNPRNFADCVKLMGMVHGQGVYMASVDSVIEYDGDLLADMIATKEDVYDSLRKYGCGRELSYNVAIDIAKSRRVLRNDRYDDFLDFCRSKSIPRVNVHMMTRVSYLFSRAQCADYMRITWYLAWFKANYPDVYSKEVDLFEKRHIAEAAKKARMKKAALQKMD